MALSFSLTFPTNPVNPLSLTSLIAWVRGITISGTGTIGASDLASSLALATKLVPGPYFYGTGALTASTYAVTMAGPALAALANGALIGFKADSANPSGGTNLNVSTLGAKAAYYQGKALPQGLIRTNSLVYAAYNTSLNGGAGVWEILSVGQLPDDHFESVATTGTNDYVSTFSPTIPALVNGTRCRFVIPNTNTAACTFAPDGLTAKPIKKNFNNALIGGDLLVGMMAEVVYDSTNQWWQLQSPIAQTTSVQAVIAVARNLVGVKTSASRVTYTADEIILKNSSGTPYLASNFTEFADFGTGTGVAGGSEAAEASSTWYAVWAIYNPSTGDAALFLSTSATAPTLPTGYTFKALLGFAYNDGSSNFLDFQQYDRTVAMQSVTVFPSGASPTVLTSLSLATAVPPEAKEAWGVIGTTAANSLRALMSPETAFTSIQDFTCREASAVGAGSLFHASMPWRLVLRTAQTVFWYTAASNNHAITVTGFRF